MFGDVLQSSTVVFIKPEAVGMKNTTLWASTSLFNFCIVGLLGFILRSKILFDLPWINYLNLLDAHSRFAFGGWITLALLMYHAITANNICSNDI